MSIVDRANNVALLNAGIMSADVLDDIMARLKFSVHFVDFEAVLLCYVCFF